MPWAPRTTTARPPGRAGRAPGPRAGAETGARVDDADAGRRAADSEGEGAGDGGSSAGGAGIGGAGVERAVLWRRRRRAAQDGREGLPALTRARR